MQRHLTDATRRAEWRSDVRLALKLLGDRMSLAPEAQLPDLRAALPTDDELPTGAGLISHINRQVQSGVIDEETGNSRRYAVRALLPRLFGEDWESRSLVNFDLAKALPKIEDRNVRKRASALRAALREYDLSHPRRLGRVVDDAYTARRWKYTTDFRPTGSGLLNLLHHKEQLGQIPPKQANRGKAAVRWILGQSLGEGWELRDLRSMDLTEMVGSCRYTRAGRSEYPSAFRKAIAEYNREYPDSLPELAAHIVFRHPIEASVEDIRERVTSSHGDCFSR